jgi:hypothetical protein
VIGESLAIYDLAIGDLLAITRRASSSEMSDRHQISNKSQIATRQSTTIHKSRIAKSQV